MVSYSWLLSRASGLLVSVFGLYSDRVVETPDSRLDLNTAVTHVLQTLTRQLRYIFWGHYTNCYLTMGIAEILPRCFSQHFLLLSSQSQHLARWLLLWEICSSENCDVLQTFRGPCSLIAHAPFDNRRHPNRPDDNSSCPTQFASSSKLSDVPSPPLPHSKNIHLTATTSINGC